MRTFDFRSDTVTQPTPNMRKAMFEAVVGDDVYRDDPTVNELESKCAALLGKEAALFVPSGTFGNQLAILTHTKRGDEVILGDACHILRYEVGAAAVIAGVQLRSAPTEKGCFYPGHLEKLIRGDDIHFPETGLICIENAHSGGNAVPLEHMAAVYKIAGDNGIPVHLDGARLFNAALALGVEAKAIAAYADSIMFCLSKGLCAPIGSMLVGNRSFIERARKNRKMMGGGLRQVGILAAAGRIAIEEMIPALADDHLMANRLAAGLEKIPKIEVQQAQRDINFVFCKIALPMPLEAFTEALSAKGLIVTGTPDGHFRFVANHDTPEEGVDLLIDTLKTLLS
ncbi:low specificity L-threonine aldolase [Fusibacter paucivorans]|uniref:Low specificity L-threonine aldolase n=1 Tax=Fusibacter paucivorans TaxID=76009 RepID=A0ABS5PR03_9FIRM|nr:low specificity L-threonine aldolase [Fusibacter paucivorans]MBS7527352.1 low specificity L-threonine aldolase [Fusibacter paucivorans]